MGSWQGTLPDGVTKFKGRLFLRVMRMLVIGLVLGASVVASAERVRVVEGSRSLILRATDIVIVEIVAAADAGVDGQGRPMAKIRVKAVEVLKGAIDAGARAEVRVIHYAPGTPTTARHAGVWSYAELSVGARFVVFADADTKVARLEDVTADAASIGVMGPEVIDEIRLANETDASGYAEVIERARRQASTLHGLFADYVIARADVKRDADALATLIEDERLGQEARATLVIDAGDWSRSNAAAHDRIARALFANLTIEAAVALRDNLIGTWIPDVIGDGEDRRTPAQVFRGHGREREAARRALRAYRGASDAKALINWLR
jgi:hypothetical protein